MTPEEAARELAEIAADLRVHLEVTRASGVLALPRGELSPRRIPSSRPHFYASEGEVAATPQRATRTPPRSSPRPAPARKPPPLKVPELSERQKTPEQPPARPAAPRPAARKPASAGKWAAYSGKRDHAADLRAIRAASGRTCPVCRNIILIGEGSVDADLFIVGSAEDKRPMGQPFGGPPGAMLDKMLSHVLGLSREQVFVADICPCEFPKNNESPARGSCGAALWAQINAVSPLVILSMGRPSTQALVGGRRGFNALRGRWQRFNDKTPVMPTFHPTWLTENPTDKRLAFEDLKAAAARYRELGGK